jgi:hypothetical protein
LAPNDASFPGASPYKGRMILSENRFPLFGIMRDTRLVADKFNDDSLQIGSLATRRSYRSLAMKFAMPPAFVHSAAFRRKEFGYHDEA